MLLQTVSDKPESKPDGEGESSDDADDTEDTGKGNKWDPLAVLLKKGQIEKKKGRKEIERDNIYNTYLYILLI